MITNGAHFSVYWTATNIEISTGGAGECSVCSSSDEAFQFLDFWYDRCDRAPKRISVWTSAALTPALFLPRGHGARSRHEALALLGSESGPKSGEDASLVRVLEWGASRPILGVAYSAGWYERLVRWSTDRNLELTITPLWHVAPPTWSAYTKNPATMYHTVTNPHNQFIFEPVP